MPFKLNSVDTSYFVSFEKEKEKNKEQIYFFNFEKHFNEGTRIEKVHVEHTPFKILIYPT